MQELLILANAASEPRAPAARWTAAVAADCSRITGNRKTDKLLGTLPWPGAPAELDFVHAQLVTQGIKLQNLTPGGKETHYGPDGHAPERRQDLQFRVRAMMTIQIPKAIRYGALAGRNSRARETQATSTSSGVWVTEASRRPPARSSP